MPGFSFALPNFWANSHITSKNLGGFVQDKTMEAPETLEEAKEIGERGLQETQRRLPGILERIWKEEVLPVWRKMYEWFKANIWSRIVAFFKKEVKPRAEEEIKKRKQIIGEEFEKEKQEMKEELPKVRKTLWERFLELIK